MGPIIILLSMVVIQTYGEVFSSVSDMQEIFQLERNLVGELLNYAEKLQGKLNRIKMWELWDIEQHFIYQKRHYLWMCLDVSYENLV